MSSLNVMRAFTTEVWRRYEKLKENRHVQIRKVTSFFPQIIHVQFDTKQKEGIQKMHMHVNETR